MLFNALTGILHLTRGAQHGVKGNDLLWGGGFYHIIFVQRRVAWCCHLFVSWDHFPYDW